MTRARVNPGICGLSTEVEVTKGEGTLLVVSLRSECPMVQKFGDDLEAVDTMDLFQPILVNPVYQTASPRLRHASCPVVVAVLKAAEVEAGMALPREVRIEFDREGGERP